MRLLTYSYRVDLVVCAALALSRDLLVLPFALLVAIAGSAALSALELVAAERPRVACVSLALCLYALFGALKLYLIFDEEDPDTAAHMAPYIWLLVQYVVFSTAINALLSARRILPHHFRD